MTVKTWAAVAMTTVMTLQSPLPAAESLVTARLGEQDTCKVTGVTTVTAKGRTGGTIRFDLAKFKRPGKVRRALLRLWVNLDRRAPLGRQFAITRWDEPEFDGLKVWQVGGPEKPLDVVYPFYSSVACHEWDVTTAVRAWLADPASNKGLNTNFLLPGNGFAPAWQRAYLQITCEGPNPNRPAQPTELKAFYRSGQVFLTWKKIPHEGAFFDCVYRIYMHAEPITAANLHKARLLGQANQNSQINVRRTCYAYGGLASYGPYRFFLAYFKRDPKKNRVTEVNRQLPPHYNFVIDDKWPLSAAGGKWLANAKALPTGYTKLEGPRLPDEAGLFVHTVSAPGKAYFAVTTALEGNENRQDFSAGNALPEPLEVKVAPPRPVLQVAFNAHGRKLPRYQYRQHTYWGGGEKTAPLHSEPSTPFEMLVNVPAQYVGLAPAGRPPTVTIADMKAFRATVKEDRWLPPTRLAPFPALRTSLTFTGWPTALKHFHGSRDPAEADRNPGFAFPPCWMLDVYGYHDRLNTGKDPRQAVVQPYYENRTLRALDGFFSELPKASRDYVMPRGQSDTLLLGIHHPDVFASIDCAQEMPWTAPKARKFWPLVGRREWKLKNSQGFNVWQWNDPVWYSRKFPDRAWPFLSTYQSVNYARSDNLTYWRNEGYPEFYLDLAAEKRGGRWWWGTSGDAPDGKGELIPRNQAYPAFTKVNFAETPPREWRSEPRGTTNGYLAWDSPTRPFSRKVKTALPADRVDTPARFEMAIRISDVGIRQNGPGGVDPTGAKYGRTDVTFWRLQQFKVEKGKRYVWTNRKTATGQVLQVGTIQPDEHGRLTISGLMVDRDPTGNKVTLVPAAGAKVPKVDESAKVGALSYAEYVKQCDNPVLMPEVKAPSTRFTVKELAGRGDPDGSITYDGKGGFGLGSFRARLLFVEGGNYVVTVRAKGTYGVSWPVLNVWTGAGTQVAGYHIVDSVDWAEYRWYLRLPPGRQWVTVGSPVNDYYMAAQLGDLRANRKMGLADVTFTRLDDSRAEKTPVEIRLSPHGIVVPVGLRTQMTASVLNGLGKPTDVPVTWRCRGADMDGRGRLLFTKAGTCVVEAAAAGLKQSVTLTGREKMVENFNEGGGTLRDGWKIVDLGGKPGRWATPARGHHLLNSLWQSQRETRSMLLWEHGTPWTHYSIQADVIIAPRTRHPADGTRGLVVRAKDKDNLYRLEVVRKGESAVARLIKRRGGAETVLATSKKVPPYAPLDWNVNPSCRGWHSMDPKKAQTFFKDWHLDRLRVQVKGGMLRAWINGQEAFPGGVKDADLPAGSAGLYAESPCCFDNVQVKAE